MQAMSHREETRPYELSITVTPSFTMFFQNKFKIRQAKKGMGRFDHCIVREPS